LAVFLDAGYLWPMLQSQALFPRLTADRFTSALSLVWFAILPLRGKVLPANGNGHELSVYIGPVLVYCCGDIGPGFAADYGGTGPTLAGP